MIPKHYNYVIDELSIIKNGLNDTNKAPDELILRNLLRNSFY